MDAQRNLRVLIADRAERLDKFLSAELPEFSRTRLTELIDSGGVTVDGRAEKRSFKLSEGMSVSLPLPEDRAAHDLTPADIPIQVLYEDDDMMVVNKPRGLATHPAPSLREPSLVNALLGMRTDLSSTGGAFRPGIVHRLDKETTGVLLIAKTDAAHVSLAKQIEKRTAKREYLAIVLGDLRIDGNSMRIEAPIGRDPKNRQRMALTQEGKSATTHLSVVQRVDAGTLIRCRLETGRTHQIRVHLASIGHPVLGDTVYGGRSTEAMQLHAWRIEFEDLKGTTHSVEAPLPPDFLATLASPSP